MSGRTQTNPMMEAVAAEVGVPEGAAQEQFGLGVLCLVGAHHPRVGFALGFGRSFVADVHGDNGKWLVVNCEWWAGNGEYCKQ